jgi:hypothetical protein
MSKRPATGGLGSLLGKKSRLDARTASTSTGNGSGGGGNSLASRNPFLSNPVLHPEKALQNYLGEARNSARQYYGHKKPPYTEPFCEIEARIGILQINNQRRVTSSGVKRIKGHVVPAFDTTKQRASMVSGISRSHYVHWTLAGLSEVSPLSAALGVQIKPNTPNKEAIARIKHELVETEMVETVFAGYPRERRVSVPGVMLSNETAISGGKHGQMEYKEKLVQRDWTVPASKYDLRIGLASEKVVDSAVTSIPPGWTIHRIKRRRSYKRKDNSMHWQIDVTEVTSTPRDDTTNKTVTYELEFEILPKTLLQFLNEQDNDKAAQLAYDLSKQLWWMVGQINPLEDVVDVEEYLQEHPNRQATQLALATCGALKRFMERPPAVVAGKPAHIDSPLSRPKETPSPSLANLNFCGCMPVNFSRHDIEKVQQSDSYWLSEKTDGVRHFMVFTGDTVVLVDRAMKGKQPIPLSEGAEPMAHVLPLIQPGTVLDGEVVMHRGGPKHKARPIFIVFDVLTVGPTAAILHLPFEQRLHHLKMASFRTKTANRDMFADANVANPNLALPLVRKNFVKRTELADLLANVAEEKGMRAFRKAPVHHHLTDGIIFQPNRPYVCGTDMNLLKWKYLDTVTIDVELLPARHNQSDDDLNVGVMGTDQTSIDMSRYLKSLPKSERFRLEADKFESGARIAEVGFDPETGEWYYLTMRPDKIAPNHISTVLGTLLELSESLTTEELQYRMSVPPGTRDTYRKDLKGMLKQLLDFQTKSNNSRQQHNNRR